MAIGIFFAGAMALGVFFIGLKAGYNVNLFGYLESVVRYCNYSPLSTRYETRSARRQE